MSTLAAVHLLTNQLCASAAACLATCSAWARQYQLCLLYHTQPAWQESQISPIAYGVSAAAVVYVSLWSAQWAAL